LRSTATNAANFASNAVKQLLDRMKFGNRSSSQNPGTQEQMMTHAGIQVQSYTELLDQEFWNRFRKKTRKKFSLP